MILLLLTVHSGPQKKQVHGYPFIAGHKGSVLLSSSISSLCLLPVLSSVCVCVCVCARVCVYAHTRVCTSNSVYGQDFALYKYFKYYYYFHKSH